MPARQHSNNTQYEDPYQFEEFIDEFAGASPSMVQDLADFSPAIDIQEKTYEFVISVDLPGVKKEHIKVDVTNGILTVAGERVKRAEGESHYTERVYGKFLRSFSVPESANADKILAHFEEGILTLTLPKHKNHTSRAVKVQ